MLGDLLIRGEIVPAGMTVEEYIEELDAEIARRRVLDDEEREPTEEEGDGV